ncbi:MAG: tetratricopeptide repeat protein [Planctomycetaceae bacterium]
MSEETRLQKIESQLAQSPDDPFLNYCQALELGKAGQVDAARAAFQRVQTLDPKDVAAFFQEGQLLARVGQTDAAREVLQTGMARARETGNSHALGEMNAFLESLG